MKPVELYWKNRFTLGSASITLFFSTRELAEERRDRRERRRVSSWTQSNSGGGGAYSTGAVETRARQLGDGKDECLEGEKEEESLGVKRKLLEG